MLIVHVHNEGTRPDNTADYTYKVYVNQKKIASGEVRGHQRSDGWQELLRMVADTTTTSRVGSTVNKNVSAQKGVKWMPEIL